MIFTIAIPTFNNESTIVAAIKSALNQDIDIEYEVLVVNNASTDLTLEKIKSIKSSKMRIINNKVTVSMWENHNICLKEAKRDYVLFCHSDDKLEPNALEILYDKISKRKFPKKYVVWGHSYFRDFQSALIRTNWNINEKIVGERAYTLFLFGGLTPSGTCYSRKSFLEQGGFIELNNKLAPSDCITMINLAFNGFIFEMIDELYFKREIASTMKIGTSLQDILETFDEMAEWIIRNYDNNRINKIIFPNINTMLVHFLYAFSNYKKYKKNIFVKCIKQFIKHPLIVFNEVYRKTIKRCLFV